MPAPEEKPVSIVHGVFLERYGWIDEVSVQLQGQCISPRPAATWSQPLALVPLVGTCLLLNGRANKSYLCLTFQVRRTFPIKHRYPDRVVGRRMTAVK